MGCRLKEIFLLVSVAACLVAQSSALCPLHWLQYGCHCYRHFGRRVTWEEARNSCREYGSELVSLHDADENDFVYELWKSNTDIYCVKRGYWIGANDRAEEGTFVYPDLTPFDYTNWLPAQPERGWEAQPDNYAVWIPGGENCAHVWYQDTDSNRIRGWNDWRCGQTLAYICKKSPI